MRILSVGYSYTASYHDPHQWLERIGFYTGVLEALAVTHTVFSIEQINFKGQVEKNGVQYHFLQYARTKNYFPFRLHRYIRRLDPDIIFVNGFIFPFQLLQLRLQMGSKAKIYLLHRGEKPGEGLRGFLQKKADHFVDGYFFAATEFGAAWTIKGHISSEAKIHEIMQASSIFRAAAKKPAMALTANFLFVGRLNENKDPCTVVKAFIRFLKVMPAAQLYLIYQTQELLPEIENLILSDRQAMESIHLIGSVHHPFLQSWYNTADFILSGSHHEGSGIAVTEAMSCGCIPIVTQITSFEKMLGAGKCGLLYPPGDVDKLYQNLLAAMQMDREVEREKVKQQFQETLSFEAIASKINHLLASNLCKQ
jgi:glycosyltransferase involved in cell wall biosynthesis